MKKKGHPQYQKVLFVDSSTGHKFLCGSTLQPKETEVLDGVEYPVYRVSVSSASHPFFTGSAQFVDTEGRVDKFKKRYAAPAVKPKPKPKIEKKAVKPKKKPTAKPKAPKAAAPKATAKAKDKPTIKAKDKPTTKKTSASK